MGNKDFDRSLLLKKGRIQYINDKRKGGMSSSTKGMPRKYARQNMLIARLYSPKLIGQSVIVTPKANFMGFRTGIYYEWKVVEEGVGYIGGMLLDADEIKQNFIVKRRKDG